MPEVAKQFPPPIRPSPVNWIRRVRATWSGAFAVAFLLALVVLGPLRSVVFPRPYSQMPAAGKPGPSAWQGADAGRAAGGVFSMDPLVAAALWGTRINAEGGDGFTGEIVLVCDAPGATRLVLPLTGRTSEPNALRVRALDGEGGVLREFAHPGRDFSIEVRHWEFEVPEGTARIEVTLVDTMPGSGGWLGLGKLSTATGAARDPVLQPVLNFGFFLAHAVAFAGFIFLPGLALNSAMRRAPVSVALLPVAGFALAAGAGLAIWLAGPPTGGAIATVYKLLHVAFALVVIVFERRAPAYDADGRHALRLYSVAVAVVTVWSIVPLTVEKEFFAGTNVRGRMVASPPDNAIPYFTAAYFLDHSDGGADETRYFGHEWTVTSRGPLPAWVVVTGLSAFKVKPHEPPLIAPNAWPADREGYFVSRIAGIFTNAFVILGAFSLLKTFVPARRDLLWFGMGWVALSPVVMINLAFLWPKMLATYFGLLAAVEIAGKRRGPETGLWLALAYLSHPVGVLIAAPALLWSGVLAARGALLFRVRSDFFVGRIAWNGLWMVVFASPWLLFKILEGKPDVFFRYPLGHGHGFQAAPSLESWLSCRWDNIWYSLVPGTLWQSDLLVRWANGLSTPGHWAMNCAKTLPFGVGIAMFLLVVRWLWVRRNGTLNTFRICVLGAGFLLMVVVWGFSRDGLGRNCLEPLVVFTIIATAAVMPRVDLTARILSVLLALEAGALLLLAYLGNPGFRTANAPSSAWVLIGVTGVAWAALTWLALSRPRTETTEVAVDR